MVCYPLLIAIEFRNKAKDIGIYRTHDSPSRRSYSRSTHRIDTLGRSNGRIDTAGRSNNRIDTLGRSSNRIDKLGRSAHRIDELGRSQHRLGKHEYLSKELLFAFK